MRFAHATLAGMVVLTLASATADRSGGAARASHAASTAARPVAPRALAPTPRLEPPSLDALRARRAQRALDDYVAYSRYPPWSRPLEEHAELDRPHAVASVVIPLGDDGVTVELTQSRLFTVPGDRVTLEIGARRRGVRIAARADWGPLRIDGSPLAIEPAPVDRGDGAAAVELALDAQALGPRAGELTLVAGVAAGGAHGIVTFVFVHTGPPPARVEGVARDRIEDGSLRIDLVLDVVRGGLYHLLARLDDADDRPVALLRFSGELAAGRQEIALVAHGRLLRDEEAAPPWKLRDVEGFRLLRGAHPDREVVATWPGPYRTTTDSTEHLTHEEWDSPARRARSSALSTLAEDLQTGVVDPAPGPVNRRLTWLPTHP